EALLRLLTDQPFETVPKLGRAPVLPPRDAAAGPPEAAADVLALVRRLVTRASGRNEAGVQADVRQLLLVGDLGLGESDLVVEPDAHVEARRRIDVPAGFTTLEVRADLRVEEGAQ